MVNCELRVRISRTACISRCKNRWRKTSGRSIRINQIIPAKEVNMDVSIENYSMDEKRSYMFVCNLTRSSFCDGKKFIHLQAGAAYKRAVNIGLGEELSSIGRSHRAAIQHTDGLRGFIPK